jgi:hypothetical protein
VQQRLTRQHEYWVYGAGGALSLTGIGWLICHYALRSPGPGPHPLEVWWLRLHGGALVGFLIVLGSVLPTHVRYGWRHRMNLRTGISVLVVALVLALTGYGLYYLVDDDWRAWTSIGHWVGGLLGTALLAIHAALGKRGAHARRTPASIRTIDRRYESAGSGVSRMQNAPHSSNTDAAIGAEANSATLVNASAVMQSAARTLTLSPAE